MKERNYPLKVDNVTLITEEMEGSRVLKIRVISMILKKQLSNLKKNAAISKKILKKTNLVDK